jgi:2-polyprenyl-6-methoxyphenol hydroxylase-like FAD-dependent oxidoreductase
MTSFGIVGGGIGGVAAAVALRRAGFDATVYERAPRLGEVGAGMMLWPNATRVLRELGVLESVIALSGENSHFLVRASCGKILMDIALGEFDVPALCTRRSDLLAALLSALPPAQLRLGLELVRLEQLRGKVQLHFSGGHIAEHDAVIGADGIRSRVRAQLLGPIEPVYRGYTVWRGVARYRGGAVRPGVNSETWGRGKRFGILDVGSGRFTWYAASNGSPGAQKRELREMFAGWHAPIEDFIDATPEEEILTNGAYDLPPLARWGEGRISLLGDAAHPCTPNLGQGGCMAIEDALVLAKCAARQSAVEIALRQYEALRSRRTRHIQKRSLLMGHIGQWENRVLVAGRRVVTGLLPPALFERNLRRVYSYET